ncbi:MAG: FAD-dependent oxidoreductase [Lachnospiraceae bacterium]
MKPRYKHLLSPLKIRGHILKNRITAANSLPHFLQGPESYPANGVISHYRNKARGASMVCCMGINNGTTGKQLPMELDFGHMPDYNLYDCTSQNYLLQLTDVIHYYDSLAGMSIFVGPPSNFPLMKKRQPHVVQGNVNACEHNAEKPFDIPLEDGFDIEWIPAHKAPHEYTEEELNKIAASYAEQAAILKMLDFDILNLHFAYRANAPAKFFSPITNKRTDHLGGSLENRMKFPLRVLKGIREQVGNDFLIELLWSAEDVPGGYTLSDTVTFLNEAKQYIDIVQLRAPDADPAHPTGFTAEATPFLHYAEYVKQHVDGLTVETVGGYHDLEACEQAIAEGKTDLIAMARAFISNSNYGELVKEGRGEDVVPCLRCNKCHGRGERDPFHSVCSVNPVIGLEDRIDAMIAPVKKQKNIAVVGGGPAGMRCSLYLAERGHLVTIYESEATLGGAIRHSDYAVFKWPLRDFKNYLIRQVEKTDRITVKLNTAASPELLEEEHYDTIICALGAKPVVPPISGLTETSYVTAEQAFSNPESLGHQVVVIGGGEVGVEAGIHLAQNGHQATVLEMRDQLAADATKIHYRLTFQDYWESTSGFRGIVNARVTHVEPGAVCYSDPDGTEHKITADSIVVSAGMRGRSEEALGFYNIAEEFYMIGDCKRAATVQQAMRSAFAVAMQV